MKRLTLSFDNGPDPACTPGVLDALGERGVRATFFVCGRGNPHHPAMGATGATARRILERIRREGHWIGNHGLTHALELGTTGDRSAIAREIGESQEILGELAEGRLFRPYMGGGILCERTFGREAIRYLCDEGYTVVLFNALPRDWEDPRGWPETALTQIEQRDWTLLVVHDVARYGGMRELPRLLDEVARRGIEIVQEFPPDCVPIRAGERLVPLEALGVPPGPPDTPPAKRRGRAARDVRRS